MNAHTRFEAQHKAGQAHGRRGHHPRTGRRQAKPPASSTQRDGSSRLGRTATRHKPAREGGREGHPNHTPRNKLTRTQQVGTAAERLAAAGSRDARRHHAHTGVQVRCDVRLLLRAEKRQRQGGHTHTHTQNRGTREPKQTAPPAAGTQHKPNQGHGTTPRHCAAAANRERTRLQAGCARDEGGAAAARRRAAFTRWTGSRGASGQAGRSCGTSSSCPPCAAWCSCGCSTHANTGSVRGKTAAACKQDHRGPRT